METWKEKLGPFVPGAFGFLALGFLFLMDIVLAKISSRSRNAEQDYLDQQRRQNEKQ